MLSWDEGWKIGLIHIQPGRPMQNGRVESFRGRLCDECLNASWFSTLGDEIISELNLTEKLQLSLVEKTGAGHWDGDSGRTPSVHRYERQQGAGGGLRG